MQFNPRSEKSLIKLFPTLEPVISLEGVYRSELPGPKFMVPFKNIFLTLSGLPNWGGKHFFGDYALNIIKKNGKATDGPKMNLQVGKQQDDGKVGLIANYDENSPYIWRHCTDEFRRVNETTILGVSHFDLPGLRGKPVMFILHQDKSSV